MPTRSARRAPCRLAGQGSVEFILVMPVLLAFLFAIGSFAMLSYQNTVIQHSLATLADSLPTGWQERDRDELVRRPRLLRHRPREG